MRAMRHLALLSAGALLLGAALPLSCSQQAAGAARQEGGFAYQAIAGGLGLLTGPRGGNVGVFEAEGGLLLVDTQFDNTVEPLRKALEQAGKGAPIRWIVNTHCHMDHAGGNAGLGGGATRMAHELVRERLMKPAAGGKPVSGDGLPQLVYADGVRLHLGGEEIELRHVGPAHTDGDTIVLFHGAKTVHLGDLMFHGMFPFVDLDSGGSVAGMLAALKAVREEVPADWTLIPGHGKLADRKALDATIAMVEETLVLVRERVAQGMTLPQILGAGLPEQYASWDWSFVPTHRWLETLARECGAKE